MLKQWDYLPEGFCRATSRDLLGLLGGPSLIHLQGERPERLFISILLHGNEDTGLLAIQEVLRKYRNRKLPRSISLFVGNVLAAHKGLRRLPDQPDYNRCWPGSEAEPCAESEMMQSIYDLMAEQSLFASIDLHNNTGLNPHYACVNRLDHRFLQLATLFSRTVVYFIHPKGVQSQAFADLCPSVTLECGRVGQAHGVEHAVEFIDACLHMDHLSRHPVSAHDMELFHTVAQVKIPAEVSFSFGEQEAELMLHPEIDHMNFRELPSGTVWGEVNSEQKQPIYACNEEGDEVSGRYFQILASQLKLKRAVMPSMLTLDEQVIRQDCLCYLMEQIPYQQLLELISEPELVEAEEQIRST